MTLTDVLQTREEYAQFLELKNALIINNPSGSGAIEVSGSTNAFIDLKSPNSDDFDVRLGTIGGTSATLETANNQPLAIYAGSGNVNIQPFGNGRVGIGTSSPQSLLHLTGTTAQASIITLLNTANTAGERGMRVAFDASPARLTIQRASDAGAFEANYFAVMQDTGNVGINTIDPVNKLQVFGSFGRGAPVTETGDFTLADTENWIIVNKGSSCVVTLPAASSWTGREFTIKVITAHTVVSASSNVVPANSATPGTAILSAIAGAWATLVSNGTNWVIMANS